MLTLLILLLIKHGTNAFLFVALLATRHGGFVSLRWLVVSRKRYFKGDVDRSISLPPPRLMGVNREKLPENCQI